MYGAFSSLRAGVTPRAPWHWQPFLVFVRAGWGVAAQASRPLHSLRSLAFVCSFTLDSLAFWREGSARVSTRRGGESAAGPERRVCSQETRVERRARKGRVPVRATAKGGGAGKRLVMAAAA